MFLVQRPGPTSFVVREEGRSPDGKPCRVLVGARQTCSCGGGLRVAKVGKTYAGGHGHARGGGGGDGESSTESVAGGGDAPEAPCAHLIFVMTKVLRVPSSNPLVWQLSLVDRELDEVLRCEPLKPKPLGSRNALQSTTRAKAKKKEDNRRELEPDEPCPICYEDMDPNTLEALVWCKKGCGRNMHGRCLMMYADHQACIERDLSCPLCRCSWGELDWTPPRPGAQGTRTRVPYTSEARGRQSDAHYGVSCGACRAVPVMGTRHKCVICQHYNLCAGCFRGGAHGEHPFVTIGFPGGPETPADRDDIMPAPEEDEAEDDENENENDTRGARGAAGSAEPADERAVSAAIAAAAEGRFGTVTAGATAEEPHPHMSDMSDEEYSDAEGEMGRVALAGGAFGGSRGGGVSHGRHTTSGPRRPDLAIGRPVVSGGAQDQSHRGGRRRGGALLGSQRLHGGGEGGGTFRGERFDLTAGLDAGLGGGATCRSVGGSRARKPPGKKPSSSSTSSAGRDGGDAGMDLSGFSLQGVSLGGTTNGGREAHGAGLGGERAAAGMGAAAGAGGFGRSHGPRTLPGGGGGGTGGGGRGARVTGLAGVGRRPMR